MTKEDAAHNARMASHKMFAAEAMLQDAKYFLMRDKTLEPIAHEVEVNRQQLAELTMLLLKISNEEEKKKDGEWKNEADSGQHAGDQKLEAHARRSHPHKAGA